MRKAKSKTVAVGLAAIGMSLVASSAWADPYLPGLTNLNFQTLNGTGPKSSFTSADPAGWTGGTASFSSPPYRHSPSRPQGLPTSPHMEIPSEP